MLHLVARISLLAALWLFSTSVRAQGAVPGGLTVPAGYPGAIGEAIAEFDRGNFSEAREHFYRAHALFPNARTLRGLGMSDFELRNYVESLTNLEMALASKERPLEGKLREETVALLARAHAYVGELRLHLEPSSSGVRVDNAPIEHGKTDHLRLAVGDHVLDFSAAGFLSERRTVKIRGEQRMDLNLRLVALSASDHERASVMQPNHNDAREPGREPIYKRWWLWTGVAAIVGGGVAAAILLSARETRVEAPHQGTTGHVLTVPSDTD